MSDERVYGERRRRRAAERAEQEAALREIQEEQERGAGAAESPHSRRDLRSPPTTGWDVPALEADDEPHGSRHETRSPVSQTLAPLSPIQPVPRSMHSATGLPQRAAPTTPPRVSRPAAPSSTAPSLGSQQPVAPTPSFRAPAQAPGQQGYPTVSMPPAAQPPVQPPTVARPGSAPGVFGSAPGAGSAGAPSPSVDRTPAAPPRVPTDEPSIAPGQPQSWGEMIQGFPASQPGLGMQSPPPAPPLSVFGGPTTPGLHPSTTPNQLGAPAVAGQVAPPAIPTSGIVIPTVLGQVPTSGVRPPAVASPNWSAGVETGLPMLGGGTFASTVVKDRKVAAFDDDDAQPHSYTWLQLLVLVIVAFVLGMLIWLLINGGSSAVASAAANALFVPTLLRRGGRRYPHHVSGERPRPRGEL